MTIRLGVVMDPIATINYKKDSTLSMLWEAEERNWEIYYFEQRDLFLRDAVPYGAANILKVSHDPTSWYEFIDSKTIPLSQLNAILMRKDPPFNEEYIYTTYILEHAERLGVFVINRPQALRDSNEKFFTTDFPKLCPPSLVAQSADRLQEFLKEHKDIVCKPLNNMGGMSVFRLKEHDVNVNVVFDTLTKAGTVYIMAQKYIPEIAKGDKRILMINGEPIPSCLARMPAANDWRGNLALGAKGVVQPLSERDRYIASQVGPVLRKRGIYFAGLDVIGDYLTEINITSPTCIREIEATSGINISKQLLDVIEQHINPHVTV